MILHDIVIATRARLEREMTDDNILKLEARLEEKLAQTPVLKPRPFAAALRHENRLGLIAEIKKASPSKGVIAENFDPTKQAGIYRAGGADCLSVLTEPDFFQGQLNDLSAAREVSGLPCIRKDFIIDQYQIGQARLAGADCVLLIAAILKDWEIRAFKAAAHRYGMDALVEVHDETEAKRTVANGCKFVGINNRDLNTFEVDLGTTEKLRKLLPDDVTVVAESGVWNGDDARRLRDAGADALLVGESLMRSGDVASAIGELLKA